MVRMGYRRGLSLCIGGLLVLRRIRYVEERINLVFLWLLVPIVLILLVKVYQYHENELENARFAHDRLQLMLLDCLDNKQPMRLTFNDGVDWVEFTCPEYDSNLYNHYHHPRKRQSTNKY